MRDHATVKSHVDDLAIFGGTPAFDEQLSVGRPNIGDRRRLFDRINDLLDRRWLTNDGPYVQELEQRICKLVGVKHCILTCNATVALEILMRAADLSGEVIVPSFTFIATAHALQWLQITPVFCDIDPRTHNLDPAVVEQRLTRRTAAILAVHLWGRPCDVEALTRIAERHGLKLFFDAAHAFACSYRGRMIGRFGDAEVFSFHATKFLNTFEGGAVTTNDDALASRIRLMRNFGFSGYDTVVSVGTNGKMSEVSAAMGLTSLEGLDDLIAVNRANYYEYHDQLAGLPGISLLRYDEDERCNYQYIVAELDESAAGVPRDQLISILWAENVIARRYFYPGCHRMEPYRSSASQGASPLPHTECIAARILVLPSGTAVGATEIRKTCGILRFVLGRANEVRARLKHQYD